MNITIIFHYCLSLNTKKSLQAAQCKLPGVLNHANYYRTE